MRHFIIGFVYCVIAFASFVEARAQKKTLDVSTPADWPLINAFSISNNGWFVKYEINVESRGQAFLAQSTRYPWKKEISGVVSSIFTVDSRRVVFMHLGDSLGILDLEADSIRYVSGVVNYKVPEGGKGSCIAYQKSDSLHTLVLEDLESDIKTEYTGVSRYQFDPQGTSLLMVRNVPNNKQATVDILLLKVPNGQLNTICHSSPEADGFTFDRNGLSLAFFAMTKRDGHGELCLRYYRDGMDSAEILVDSRRAGMSGMVIQDNSLFFSKNGLELCFNIERRNTDDTLKSNALLTGADVIIRGVRYLNVVFDQSHKPCLAALDLNDNTRRVVRLQQEKDEDGSFYLDENGGWVLVEGDVVGDPKDSKWQVSARPNLYLVSTKDGARRILGERLFYDGPSFSPLGKYAIWFDRVQKQWMCHSIVENKTRNITRTIRVPVYRESDYPDFPSGFKIAGWLEGDAALLIQDRNDIWQVDPEGIKTPINLTHGYGAAKHIIFRNANFGRFPPVISVKDTLLLTAFDLINKRDGFFRLSMSDGHLEKLCFSSHIYTFRGDDFGGAPSAGPTVKAKFAEIYLLTRSSTTEYPNLYITRDFKTFDALTDLAPQKEYNWYTTELLHWILPNGKTAEGVLFKPENFNPKLRYPIIFYYYEKNASALNIFIHPELSKGQLTIPWFVSNGYLVFVPDIYYQIGHPGRSACNSVVSAAAFLSKKPWVDPHKMGLQGHSYGGEETNYIVSHSSLFAAAAPASGTSNEISAYGEAGILWYYERRQGRIGATLWDRPDLYIENSAVLRANKVTTPVLIMQTKQDWVVPYAQGFQWYNALHRLGKKAWLLTYDGEDHILHGKNSLDYSIRLGQFFDHYLKGAPAPKWMTVGVLPGMKGKDEGLELDMSGSQP